MRDGLGHLSFPGQGFGEVWMIFNMFVNSDLGMDMDVHVDIEPIWNGYGYGMEGRFGMNIMT